MKEGKEQDLLFRPLCEQVSTRSVGVQRGEN